MALRRQHICRIALAITNDEKPPTLLGVTRTGWGSFMRT
jgi:hypothetical protein